MWGLPDDGRSIAIPLLDDRPPTRMPGMISHPTPPEPADDTPTLEAELFESRTRRLLDAVGNRLEEALRVVEDQLRFRHGLAAAPRA